MVSEEKGKSKTHILTKKHIDKYKLSTILKIMKKSTLIYLCLSLFLLLFTGLAIWGETQYTWLHMPRIIVGTIVVLFLPGYWMTRWTFPVTENEKLIDSIREKAAPDETDETINTIDGLERFVLSVALSISAVPLVLFYVNFLGLPLTIWSVFATISGVTLASMGGTIFIEYRHAKSIK
jgi:uncharacterized membrane protein